MPDTLFVVGAAVVVAIVLALVFTAGEKDLPDDYDGDEFFE